MRRLLTLSLFLLASCAPAPPPVQPPKPDPTAEAWYPETIGQVAAIAKDAQKLIDQGKKDEAAAKITAGQPLVNRLLSVPKPTLTAMEAVSDLDDLYGRMLLANQHYGWARLLFQKNQTRWRVWKPQTEDTLRRLKQAEAAMRDCDRQIK